MDTIKLLKICKVDPKISPVFLGVFPSDCLPKQIAKPAALIVNTDPKNKRGRHWVAFYVDHEGKADYMDSFGLPPFPEAKNCLDATCLEWQYSNKQLQSSLTVTCGQYCVYFLNQRCRGVPFQRILNMFTDDYERNDMFVTKFVNNVYEEKTKAVDVDFVVNQIATMLE